MSLRTSILERAVYWAAPGTWKPDPASLVYFFKKAGCEQAPSVSEASRSLSSLANGCYVGAVKEANIRHWCGIWACSTLVEAGVSAKWTLFGGTIKGSGVTKVWGYQGIQPGDIAMVTKGRHHFIITKVNGSTVDSIDGNSTNNSIVTHYGKAISTIVAYYRING